MWLNEGMCMFLERKIYERLYGKAYADLKASIGYKNLIDLIKVFGEDSEYTKLCPNLNGVDPDVFNFILWIFNLGWVIFSSI